MKKIILKDTKKPKGSTAGKWFYALVFISIITVGTTGHIIRTQNDAITKMAENIGEDTPKLPPLATMPAPISENTAPGEISKPVTVPESLWESDDVEPVSTEEYGVAEEVSAAPKEDAITRLALPVPGDIIKGHSDTELVYSKTMDDWRIHKGVDIRIPIGTTVVASYPGTVVESTMDPAYGVTIMIDHGSGVMTRYSNLSSPNMVKVGAFIDGGTAIGVVGDTAEFEISDEAHLHFEVIKEGLSVNPEEYFE